MALKKHQKIGEGTSSSIWKNSTETSTPQPKFFKIIVSPHDCSSLSVPQDFGSRYCKNLQRFVHLEVPSGQVWEVEAVHSQGQISLAKGWQDFSDYYSLNCGHFLMFEYDGCSHFSVIIFDLSATEIEYPYSASHGTRHAPKRNSTELSDDSIEILEGITRSHTEKEKSPEMVDDSAENIDDCSLGKANKRVRTDVASVSFTNKGQKMSERCRVHERQSKIAYAKDKRESSTAYRRAKSFESKNPFIILFMQPSYIFSQRAYDVSVPLKFAKKYFQENSGDLELRVPGRGCWSVKCTLGSLNAKIHSGWKSFVVGNHLKVGDVCVLEVIRGARLFVDVTVFRAAGRTQMHKIDGEIPRVSAQHELDQTKNLKQPRGGSYGFNSRIKEIQGGGSKIEHSVEILDPGRSIAYRRAKAFNSKKPFIILFMQPSHVFSPYNPGISFTFARQYFLENCRDLVLRIPGSAAWSVSFDFSSQNAKICGGWKAFVVDSKLKVGDVCVFEVIKVEGTKLLIDVTIFPEAGISKMHPIDKSVPRSQPKVVQTEKSKDQWGGSYGFHSNVKDEHDEVTEILGCCPVGQGGKRKRLEREADDVISTSFTRKIKNSVESCKMHKKQSKIVNDKNKTVMDKEMSIAYQRAKAFKSKNPFIILFMQPSYVRSPFAHGVSVPLKFAKKYLQENSGDLVLRVPGRGSWSVKCTLGSFNAKIHSGWNSFVVANHLKVGDVCVLEVFKGVRLFVDITVFCAAGITQVHQMDGEIPRVSACRSKNIRTDNFVPCSQSELHHTKNAPRSQPKVVQTLKTKERRDGSYGFDSNIKEWGSKRRRLEGEAEDDVPVNVHTKSINEENLHEDAVSTSFAGKIKKSGESCRMNKKQFRIVNDKSKTVMDKERSIAYQRAKAFNSKNPFIILFMQPSFVANTYIMSIPLRFARKYFVGKISNLVLRIPGRGAWSARCNLGINANIYSGWKAFVVDNKLKVGDVCVFEVTKGKGTKFLIDVTIFPEAGSIPMHTNDNSVPHSQHKVVRMEKSKERRGGSYGFASIIKEGRDEGTEISDHCPVGQGSKRKGLEREERDDVSVGVRSKSIKVENYQEDVVLPSSAKKTKKSGESCRMRKKQSKIVYDKNKTVIDKEREIAYQRAKAFKSKNPFIILFMQPSYVSNKYMLCVSLASARKIFLKNCGKLVLRVTGKGCWSVNYKCGTMNTKIRSGWKAFVVANKLKIGDVCVFEVIKSKGTKHLVDVTIFPKSGHTPMHANNNSVLHSQRKAVQTTKSKQQTGGSYGVNLKVKEEHGEGSEIDCSFEILGHCPLGQSSKRVNVEEGADDYVSIDNNIKVEKSHEDVASPSSSRKTKKHGEIFRRHKKKSKIVYDKDTDVIDKERTSAYQRAKAFKSENPFIISFMQPSYVSKPCVLFISSTFARKYLQENCGNLVLRVPGSGSFWCVRCTIGSGSGRIHSGWKAFVVDNKLKLGDVCVFEVIKGAQLFIDVTVFRAPGRIPMHKIDGKGPVICKNNTVLDKERSIAYQRAKAFKSENPFIVLFMQPSYVLKQYNLSISFRFARKYLRENCNNLLLRVLGTGSWPVKCNLRTSRAEILCGWKAFVLENKLKIGDVCVFEVIESTQLFIDVTIFRAAGKVPVASACRNKNVKIEHLPKIKEELGEGVEMHLNHSK